MENTTAWLLASMMAHSDNVFGIPKPEDERPCLNCRKLHSHNNSFCSAECCKVYKKP